MHHSYTAVALVAALGSMNSLKGLGPIEDIGDIVAIELQRGNRYSVLGIVTFSMIIAIRASGSRAAIVAIRSTNFRIARDFSRALIEIAVDRNVSVQQAAVEILCEGLALYKSRLLI